jgi:cytosine/adenosine deaminase-related metal-dependent hydrolase
MSLLRGAPTTLAPGCRITSGPKGLSLPERTRWDAAAAGKLAAASPAATTIFFRRGCAPADQRHARDAHLAVLDFPTAYAVDADGAAIRPCGPRQVEHEPLLSFSLAPHAPYSRRCQLEEDRHLCAANLPIQTHLLETGDERAQRVRFGIDPLRRLHSLGVTGPGFIAHLEAADINCSWRTLVIVHCPTSNLKLASGIAPVANWCAAQSTLLWALTQPVQSPRRIRRNPARGVAG